VAYQDDNNGSSSGSARVLSGANGSILHTFNGDSASDYFGISVSAAGDINNDGFDDVIVGAYGDDNNGSASGSARVLSGANGAILYAFNGGSANDFFGYSVSAAGDVNKDGYDDLIVGAYVTDNNGVDSGSARVLSGVNGSILYTFYGDAANDQFGFSVHRAGDVNQDGYDDVIVGAYVDDNNGSDSGSTRVFSGANGSIIYAFNGDNTSDYFGYSVSAAGDVNNDGYDDVIVGAYGDDNNGTMSGSARVFSGKGLWTDFDSDGLNDTVDTDDDNDAVIDINDPYPLNAAISSDVDNDGVDAMVDNCPTTTNADQLNTDGDASGNACDTDDDNDGMFDVSDSFPLDGTRAGDPDSDGVDTLVDNCPSSVNADQLNTDGDSQGNACDSDDDNDGVADVPGITSVGLGELFACGAHINECREMLGK